MRASFFPYPRPLREAIRPPVIYPLIIAAERKRLQYQICTMGPQLFKLAIDYTVLTLLSGASGLLRENGRRSLCWGVTWKRQRGLGLIQGKCVYAVYYTVHPSVFICILRTVQNTAAMRADTQKLKCLMVDPPFRTPWVISICMFFFSPSWLDCWDNQNGSLSAGFRGSQHWLSHSSQARLTFKKKNHKWLSFQRWNPQKGVCTELLLYCQWALRGFICSEKSAPESVSHHYPVPEPGSWPPPLFYGATETLGLLIYRHTHARTRTQT